MAFSANKISYRNTNAFSTIVLDYLDNNPSLKKLYNYTADIEGIKKAVLDRKSFPIDRKLLQEVLQTQYKNIEVSSKLKDNIALLFSENTFTICTAHQPNIFTGHLYFIYKILHAIKLAETLQLALPENNFVPVYYMGSEDADLDELGEVYVKGFKYKWQTKQKGAVGRMIIDKAFIEIIENINGQLSIEKNGVELMKAVKDCYKEGLTIEAATFKFVHYLFGEYGLIILLPDDRNLKNKFAPIIERELQEQFSQLAVLQTVSEFPAEYKVQAAGRNINLFYLKEDIRERIEAVNDGYIVTNTTIHFTKIEMENELKLYPERFSPNVILRPVFQEMILPNVAFIGGGGEIAYWLELKRVFEAAKVFFPALILRNSFVILNKKVVAEMQKLNWLLEDIFKSNKLLLNNLVQKETNLKLDLKAEKEELKTLYESMKTVAGNVDTTLNAHVYALRTQALNKLEILEKKIFKAEKKKFEAEQRQIQKLKLTLYPNNNLQERVENILEYISIYGDDFVNTLYENSLGLEQEFTILKEV